MASNDNNDLFSTAAGSSGPGEGEGDMAPEAFVAPEAPEKKAAKRAPRKAAHKAGAPTESPAAAQGGGESATDAADEPAAPVKKAAKRAPRKATKKAAAPTQGAADAAAGVAAEVPGEAPAEVPAAKKRSRKATSPASAATQAPSRTEAPTGDVRAPMPDDASSTAAVPDDEPSPAPAPTAGFGPLFQPPAAVQVPRRRRAASSPAGPAADSPVQRDSQDAPLQDSRADAPDRTDRDTPAGRPAAEADAEPDDLSAADGSADDSSSGSGARKRRRRGGKGRKGRSGGDGDQDHGHRLADDGDDNGDNDDRHGGDRDGAESEREQSGRGSRSSGRADSGVNDHDDTDEGGSRRRTRRRRRSGAGEGDDQPGTVTKVREPRHARDEVTSIKGSTRLEAKKQRRREGREAGRRRTIITEAEFLARRESVDRVMLVRYLDGRTQIAVLEDGVVVEHYISREVNASMAGNVYLGRIQNVLPSMEAAFVDVGRGRNAVLYAGEVNWDAAGMDGKSRRIEHALKSGGSVLTQVTKDPIGHKGARLTSQISLPGRYLVYVPNSSMTGISRKLPDTERARLKKLLREIVPEHAGVIVRTAAEGASEAELRADVERLTAAWEAIEAKARTANAPALIHGEPDLTVRVIRDVFNEDFRSLEVSGQPAWDAVSDYVTTVAPDLADRLRRWTGEHDLFAHHRVDEQLAKAMDRKVWLPSGGTLVIDRTEAMTVVDVNTGKFVGSGGNLEQTVTKNNIEAAEEIVRQLRLRDIGGIIVVDFIDMVLESNRDLVMRRLVECLGRDRTKHQVAEVTSLGLVQMTRKRVGAGLIEVFSETCEACSGRGIIVHADPVDNPASGADDDRSRGSRGRHGRSGDSGSGAGGGGNGRGSGGSIQQQNAPEVRPATTGPTAAQIAAMAHAAAAKAGESSKAVQEADSTAADSTAPGTVAPASSAPAEQVPAAAVAPAPAAAVPADAVPAATDAAPAPRTRRKRGRVVAPAGPPAAHPATSLDAPAS